MEQHNIFIQFHDTLIEQHEILMALANNLVLYRIARYKNPVIYKIARDKNAGSFKKI